MRNAQGELKTTPYEAAATRAESSNKSEENRKDDHNKKVDDEDIPF